MPWRLIEFIVIFAVFLIFIVFNLDDRYRCDVNFGFRQIENVPVFVTAFTSFFLGMLCAAPFILGIPWKQKTKAGKRTVDTGQIPARKPGKKPWQQPKWKAKGGDGGGMSDGGPYGID